MGITEDDLLRRAKERLIEVSPHGTRHTLSREAEAVIHAVSGQLDERFKALSETVSTLRTKLHNIQNREDG